MKSTVGFKQYKSYRGYIEKIAPNLLERDFNTTKPDEKWVTEVTEFKVQQQKVYLLPIVDLFTQEVVAYKVAKNALVIDKLTEAVATLAKDANPMVHSDQG